jgi:hypothetical protein
VTTQETMARRERTKWNETLIVLPVHEPPFVVGTLFDPAFTIHQNYVNLTAHTNILRYCQFFTAQNSCDFY